MFLNELQREAENWHPGKHLVVEERDGLIEAFHDAHIAVVDRTGRLLYSSGDPHHVTFTRSCIKPIQALPLLYSGAADGYGLSEMELSIISGSHSGEPGHLGTVRSILEKAGLDEGLFKCGGHAPFNKDQAAIVGSEYSPIHDNCSGKHAGALACSKFNGWDLGSYTEFGHPLTLEVVKTISTLTGLDPREIFIGRDGCDIPNFGVPIDKMAQMFCLLTDAGDHSLSTHLTRLGEAMVHHPHMVAGEDRFDTILMNDFPGKVLSKAGAVGLQTVSVKTGSGWLGISIKIPDGAYSSALPLLTYHVLSELGLRSDTSNQYSTPVVKTRSDKIVGGLHSFGKLKKH